MKIVGLLSGGKDSCYNLVHCTQQGHEVVALATLSPPDGKEEIDSYLYQTVGQDAITYVAMALELPLYRQTIRGDAIEKSLHYHRPVDGDETEDLVALLTEVLRHHPEIRGVAVGAILSTYQRIRVEHVCQRLGLVSIAYLWQRDQSELLHEMQEAGMDARIIKVAGAGLLERHLGQNVASPGMIDQLTKLHQRFELHLCGEGGEYETFTIDCPLFKHRIELDETEVVRLSGSDVDPYSIVAHLRIKAAALHAKSTRLTAATVPPLLDDDATAVERAIEKEGPASIRDVSRLDFPVEALVTSASAASAGHWHAFGSISVASGAAVRRPAPSSVADEVAACFTHLSSLLNERKLTLADVVHINLSLADMSDFVAANAAYVHHFAHRAPPTRAAVSVHLGSQHRVEIDALACSIPDRKTLHVQSLSFWAPANIGPYSQAVSTDGRYFVAGQIGLIPASLELPATFARQLALSMQHVRRIMAAEGPLARMDSCICWIAAGDWSARLAAAKTAWRAWTQQAPIIFVEALALPRGALVEWQCTFVDDHLTSHPRASSVSICLDARELRATPKELFAARLFYTHSEAGLTRRQDMVSVLGGGGARSFLCVPHLASVEDDIPVACMTLSA